MLFSSRVDSANNIEIFYHTSTNVFRLKYKAGGTVKDVTIPRALIEYDTWYHLVLTWDVAADEVKGYLNGKQYGATKTALGTWSGVLISNKIGGNASADNDFNGLIDNVSLWSRVLSDSEIVELYRRGGNTVKFQIRTCDDSACLGDTWQGPDGTINTYYTENQNRLTSGNYAADGKVPLSAPNISFGDFSAPGANKFLQYKIIMESFDQNTLCSGLPCFPGTKTVEIIP